MNRNETRWVLCPACGGKTRVRVLKSTVLVDFPLYCPKCGREHLVHVRDMQIRESKILRTQTG